MRQIYCGDGSLCVAAPKVGGWPDRGPMMGGLERARGPEIAVMLGLRGGGCWRALRGCRNLLEGKRFLELFH